MPRQPTVIVCIDGSEYDYVYRAAAAGVTPFLSKPLENGTALLLKEAVKTPGMFSARAT